MHRDITFLEQDDNNTNQQFFCVLHDPVADYMEYFCSQNLQPLNNLELENEDNDQLMSESAMYFFPAGVSSHKFSVDFQPLCDNYQLNLHEGKNEVGGVTHHSENIEQCLDINLHYFDDPFATCLDSVSEFKLSDFSFFINIEFDYKFFI